MQHHLNPIWDLIEDEQWLPALQQIEKLQKRYRNPHKTLLGLQGLCLAKLGRSADAITTCEKIKALAPSSSETYSTIHDVLKSSPLDEYSVYLVKTMEDGFREIKSETMGRMWFMEAVKGGLLPSQRKAAVELQKGFLSRDYFYLVLMSMFLQYQGAEGKEKELLGMLMYRMATKAAANSGAPTTEANGSGPGPRFESAEEFYLFIDILRALSKDEEVLAALDGPIGDRFANNHEFVLLKIELLRKVHGQTCDALRRLTSTQIEQGVDDWSIFQSCVDAFEGSNDELLAILETAKARTISRNALLAAVYMHRKEADQPPMYEALRSFCTTFASSAATFEDLAPYVTALDLITRKKFLTSLETIDVGDPKKQIVLVTNIAKFKVLLNAEHPLDGPAGAVSSDFVTSSLTVYAKSLNLESNTTDDHQLGNDLLLIAVHSLLGEADDHQQFRVAVTILEHALTKAKHNFQFRLQLISLYRKLGAWSLALKHFQALDIKHIQRDTLSYIVYEKSAYEYVSTLQISGLRDSCNIYRANEHETPEMICQAYENRIYSKIPELLHFQKRLSGSSWQIEANVSICQLEILLDKIDWSKSLRHLQVVGPLFDNKSRNVQLDLRAVKGEISAKDDKTLDSQALQQLTQQAEDCIMLQAIVRGVALNDGALQPLPNHNASSRVVRACYQAKFLDAQNLATELQSIIETLVITEINVCTLGQAMLQSIGAVVQCLKIYAIVLPHLRAHQARLKETTKTVATLATQIRGDLEDVRKVLSTRKGQLDMTYLDVIHCDKTFWEKVEKEIRVAQMESVNCLLGVVKSIKL